MTSTTVGKLEGSARALGVRLEQVSRLFGTKAALDAVDLEVEPGSMTVLLGPSGSGKTTLLRCVAGIEFPSSGMLSIDGRVVAGKGVRVPPEKRGLAMVFQDYALWPHLNAHSNVTFALRRLSLPKGAAATMARRMLDRVGLGELAERYPNELSGGEQQRVALARALVARVGLVLFDEPLSNLDADLREQLRLEIATLVREVGATALYITHDQMEAFALADRVAIMRSGRIVQSGTPEEIFRRPRDAFVARFTGVAGELPVRAVREAPLPASDGGWKGPEATRAPFATIVLPDWLGGGEILATAPSGVPVAGRATVFVRPAASTIVPPSAEAHLLAEVRDAAFCGRGYEHALVAPGGVLLTRVFAETRHQRGARVGVALDPRGCLLLDSDGQRPSAPATSEDALDDLAVGKPKDAERLPVPAGS